MTFFASLARFSGFARPLRRPLSAYLSLSRQRQELRKLSPEMLSDLGITREEALKEAERPIWDAPLNWRK